MRRTHQAPPAPIDGVAASYTQVNGGKAKKRRKKKRSSTAVAVAEIVKEETTLSAEELIATATVLRKLGANTKLFHSTGAREVRAALYQLPWQRPTGLIALISDTLRNHQWTEALEALGQLGAENSLTPLGALQRWVRDCDAAGVADSTNRTPTVVLDRILRVTSPELISPLIPSNTTLQRETDSIRFFDPFILSQRDCSPPKIEGKSKRLKSSFRLVHSIAAALREPPNIHPTLLYSCNEGEMPLSLKSDHATTRVDVPGVPGAFLLQNCLSIDECKYFLAASESIGFTPDCPATGLESVLADNCNLLLPKDAHETIFRRIESSLPEGALGFNRRLRIYRYRTGNIYRPHIDGAWPGSGMSENGEYLFDEFGDRWSRLTMLIYFNDVNIKHGGATTFYLPCQNREGVLNAFPVAPVMGSILFFPHGSTAGSLLHEGSGTTKIKYVARTEVLYKKQV